MQWLKNIFKKKEPKKPVEKVKINFNEVENFLNNETKEKKEEIEREVKEYRDKFVEILNSLNEKIDKLAYANFEKLILEDKRDASKIVETNRRNYCNSSKKLISRAIDSLDGEKDPKKIESIVTDTFNKLNSFSRETQVLSVPFKEQMKKISENLKKLKEELDNFYSFLNSEYKIIEKENEAKKLLDEIQEEEKNKRKKELQIVEIDKEIKKLKKKINALSSEISKIKNSDEKTMIDSLSRDQKLLQKQKTQLISEINSMVSEISRYVKKYLHKRKIDKVGRLRIMSFLEKPERLIQTDSSFFEKIIKELRDDIEKIEKDEKKRKKFLSVENLLESRIRSIKNNYKDIEDKLSRNSKKIEELKKETNFEDKEKNLERLKEKKKQLEKDKREIGKERRDLNEIVEKLENVLSEISGKKIKIKYA